MELRYSFALDLLSVKIALGLEEGKVTMTSTSRHVNKKGLIHSWLVWHSMNRWQRAIWHWTKTINICLLYCTQACTDMNYLLDWKRERPLLKGTYFILFLIDSCYGVPDLNIYCASIPSMKNVLFILMLYLIKHPS